MLGIAAQTARPTWQEICFLQKSNYNIVHPVCSDLFHPSVRFISLTMFVCWPVITLLYYGISLSVDKINLTEDVFLRKQLIAT